jgi:hypothetical protein
MNDTMVQDQGFLSDPVTVVNILLKAPEEVAQFINTRILRNYIPDYTPNSPLSVENDLMPRMVKYCNDKAYLTELWNIVTSALFKQKKAKRVKSEDRDEAYYTDLEAKSEILKRSVYQLDSFYETASRIMTGIGTPDVRQNRHQ